MKPQQKLSLIFWIFILLCMLNGLTGCSKTEPETLISEVIKQDVEVIKTQVDAVEKTLAKECKTPAVVAQLSVLTKSIETISAKADSEVAVCEKSKDIYTQQIGKLRIIIGFLILIIVGGVILKIRKIL